VLQRRHLLLFELLVERRIVVIERRILDLLYLVDEQLRRQRVHGNFAMSQAHVHLRRLRRRLRAEVQQRRVREDVCRR
jgi:hypothetical protein